MTSYERPEFSWIPPEFPFAETPKNAVAVAIANSENKIFLMRGFSI